MYALHSRSELPRWADVDAAAWRPAWRLRWVVLALVAVALLAAGYAGTERGAQVAVGGPGRVETITVAPGDTLWTIAARRYPDADPREKVDQIEQLNGLSGPAIAAGERLEVPAG